MLIGVPETTNYDLRFRIAGIPVRVHPMFWLVTAILGMNAGREDPAYILLWIGCVFISILVHEFGHALMAWLFGSHPSVVLYGMGGLCYYPESDRQSSWQRIAVLICGPGAGFLFLGLIIVSYVALGQPTLNPVGERTLNYLTQINLVWGIINLLPVWPMDGGQITVNFLSIVNRRNGRRWGHIVSLLCAGLLAVLMFRIGQPWLAFLCAYFAYSNYQMLEAMHFTRSHFEDDPADWWKR
jgi:stage IV sporulation protein FB